MKNNLSLFLLLICSMSITMTVQKKSYKKKSQPKSKKLQSASPAVRDFKQLTMVNTRQNAINTLPTEQEKKLKKVKFTTSEHAKHYYFDASQKTDDTFAYYSNVYRPSCRKEIRNIRSNMYFNGNEANKEKNITTKMTLAERAHNRYSYKKSTLSRVNNDLYQNYRNNNSIDSENTSNSCYSSLKMLGSVSLIIGATFFVTQNEFNNHNYPI